MPETHFPSGRWTGYYVYVDGGSQFAMWLRLQFTVGSITGYGEDGVGPFTCAGWYSEQSGECGWLKQYVGAHGVDYSGTRGDGGIWGIWKLCGHRGGFKIWPEQEAENDTAIAECSHESARSVEVPV